MARKKPAARVVQATRAKNNFGAVLKRVYELDEPQIIERAGLPVAAIISISDFQRLYPQHAKNQPRLGNGAKRQQAAKEMAAFLDQLNKASARLDEDKVYQDVLQEVMAVRRERRKR